VRVAFAGAFAIRLAERVQAHLGMPCDVIQADEVEIVSQLSEVDVLVSMAFTAEMAAASRRLKLVQMPGAGLDRIDRTALPADTWLANAYGHEIGMAEYVIGAMLAFTRSFARLDASLRQGRWESQWAVSTPPHVWYQYPTGPGPTFPARQAFQELPNVLMTPHVSGWTEGMLEARARLIAENIRRAAHGEPPVHLITAAA
jgi:phosphoglycerate dehydrogenase-like enzyme